MKDEFSEINVIPLVDIMLVLIVIVLITANFMISGALPVKPPKSETEQALAADSVRLTVNRAGELFYKDEAIALDDLEKLMTDVDRERPVLISADKDLTLQPFVSLLDRLKKLQFSKISLHTER